MEILANTAPTAAAGWKYTLQHVFFRRLLLSQNSKRYCSMCSVIADAIAPDYAVVKCG